MIKRAGTDPRTLTADSQLVADGIERPAHNKTLYLIECFRLSFEEGLLRIKKRDKLLLIGMLAQLIVAALANQIEVLGISAGDKFTIAAAFAAPAATVCCALYAMENNAIGFLSDYTASLSALEKEINGGPLIDNWDASPKYRSSYIEHSTAFRYIVPIIAFLLLPAVNYIFYGHGFRISEWHPRNVQVYADFFALACLGVVGYTIMNTVKIRKQNSKIMDLSVT